MDKERLYEQIEAYLAGALSEGESRSFEQQMSDDPQLAAEVALHRQAANALGDIEKLDFRKKLSDVAGEFREPPRSGPNLRKWLPFIAAGLLISLWWSYDLTHLGTVKQENPPTANRSNPDSVETQAPPVDTLAGQTPEETPREAPPPVRNPRQAFTPNPELEKLLTLEPDAYLKVDTAMLESFPAAGGRNIRFNGRMQTAVDPLPVLELVVLDNSAPTGRAVDRLPVKLELIPDTNSNFAFAAKKNYALSADRDVRLEPGLYYLRLSVTGQTQSLWAARLRVER